MVDGLGPRTSIPRYRIRLTPRLNASATNFTAAEMLFQGAVYLHCPGAVTARPRTGFRRSLIYNQQVSRKELNESFSQRF